MQTELARLETLLKFVYGALFLAFGIDKFFNALVSWQEYVSPYLIAVGINQQAVIYIAGIAEIGIGCVLLSRWRKWGAYAAMAWFVFIVINLLTAGQYFDIAIQGAALAAGVYALGRLMDFSGNAD